MNKCEFFLSKNNHFRDLFFSYSYILRWILINLKLRISFIVLLQFFNLDLKMLKNDVKKNNEKDNLNVVFLTFLYFLQCVPLGLIGSLPYVLSSRSVSYAEQGLLLFY